MNYNQDNGVYIGNYYIPFDFYSRISSHLVKSYVNFSFGQALLLGIQGRPGDGKSFQSKLVAESMGFTITHVAASQFSGKHEGDAHTKLEEIYKDLSVKLAMGQRSVIIIDDFDLSISGLSNGVDGTVNSQLFSNYLMHICDSRPSKHGRVPIIVTGNDFSRLYGPLTRNGRMEMFEWAPTKQEKFAIWANSIKGYNIPIDVIRDIIEKYHENPLSFFFSISSKYIDKIIDEYIRDSIKEYGTTSLFSTSSQNVSGVIDGKLKSARSDIFLVCAEEVNSVKMKSYLGDKNA
ncbi:AAA family ATPase [Niveispirillum sp. KHB5.9]|uniref:AAA family ATPase n=1 Tax=Niveispirillum sp. KHB5.9 TaxID=3400269 RepID=UPI003A89A1BE